MNIISKLRTLIFSKNSFTAGTFFFFKKIMQERRGAKMLECERKELEKEKVRQAKAEAREARKKEKEYDQALKSAARESSKDMSTPKQRLKHMIILLDSTLFHNGDFMATFAPAVKECEVAYRLGTLDEPGVVRWLRMLTQRDVSESAKVVSEVVEAEESDVLLTLEAQGFVGLVHYSKQVRGGRGREVGLARREERERRGRGREGGLGEEGGRERGPEGLREEGETEEGEGLGEKRGGMKGKEER